MQKTAAVRVSLAICALLVALAYGVFFLIRSRAPQLINAFAPQRPTAFAQSLGGVQSLIFSPDGQRLFVSSDTDRVAVYQTGSWKKIAQWHFVANRIFISRDGTRLFTWEYSGGRNERSTFSMRNAADGKLLSTWQRIYNSKNSESFSSISDNLSRVALDQSTQTGKRSWIHRLKIVDAATGKEQISSSSNIEPFFNSVWLNNDKWLQLNTSQMPTPLLQTSDLKPVPSLPKTNYATLTPDGSTLVGVRNSARKDLNGTIILHDLKTHRSQEIPMPKTYLRWAYLLPDALVISGQKEIEKAQFRDFIQIRTPDGAHIKSEFDSFMPNTGALGTLISTTTSKVANGKTEKKYEIYRARDGKNIATLNRIANVLDEDWQLIDGFGGEYTTFSPDGKWFVSGDQNGLLRCWRLPAIDGAKP